MSSEQLKKFIDDNSLIIDISDTDIQNVITLSNNLISSYELYCKNANIDYIIEKRTIPYLISKLLESVKVYKQ